jgi:UDP-glucose:(glucosyl)LPS alpha-1,2-glucosyltransferase
MEVNEVSKDANGGTELMMRRIYSTVNPSLLENFQIIPSRVRELKKDKIRILYCHDMPQDPESQHLKNRGWEQFHKIVFVSYWQQQAYINAFGIPYARTTVIKNAVEQFEKVEKDNSTIRFIYHTTPHRGLRLLVPVFNKLLEKHKNIHLDVYSSFNAYGVPEADKQFEQIFQAIRSNPNMTYHGFKPNPEIRQALLKSHIYAYPCIWPETSCISLIEAMQAGLICVHPTLAALTETGAGSTLMYDFIEDDEKHAEVFYSMVNNLLENLTPESLVHIPTFSTGLSKVLYNWEDKKTQWENLLNYLLLTVENRESAKEKEYLYVST